MSVQRKHPADTLQHIITSFKQFEKKLDQLQDDVQYHGHTLSELRVMVANLSSGSIMYPNGKIEEPKHLLNKTITMQNDDHKIFNETLKKKQKIITQPLPVKIATKNLKGQVKVHSKDSRYLINKISATPKPGLSCKRSLRHRKSEVARKTIALQKEKQKKQVSNLKQFR